jgi:hypothetical protein
MANKDKFKQMKQGGGFSFQDMVQQAATVAAIEKQVEQPTPPPAAEAKPEEKPKPVQPAAQEPVRYMRLPNPQIPITEYNLVTRYCEQFPNMTRQDFVELAIIEKLHTDGGMSQEEFNARYEEIRNRPPRGHRKNTKNQSK